MADIARLLKAEITRLAKKEVKKAVSPLKQEIIQLKKVNTALKRRIEGLEKNNKPLLTNEKKRIEQQAKTLPDDAHSYRLTARTVKALRKKFGLSQDEFAKLVGLASGQSVYQMEKQKGVLKIRSKTKAAILAVKDIGKREAKSRLVLSN